MRTINLSLMALVVLLLSTSCESNQKQTELKPIAEHVVMIGLDGFGAYAYQQAEMPNLKKLASQGAWTLNSRTVLPSSSAVNWASMLMSSVPTLHGYTEWGSKEPEIPSAALSQYGKFPSIYTQIREQKPEAKTGVIYSWGGIIYLLEKEIIDYVIPTQDNDDLTAEKAVEVITNHKPMFTFIHIDEPDGAGHNMGHDTPAYYEELKHVDQLVGKIIDAVEKAGIADKTVIMVVSDHGGIEKGHGGKSLQEVTIPFFAKGPGIKVNHEIKDVVVDFDYGITIAKILGIKPHQAWRGRVIEDIFMK